jgi:hypothetical protein
MDAWSIDTFLHYEGERAATLRLESVSMKDEDCD